MLFGIRWLLWNILKIWGQVLLDNEGNEYLGFNEGSVDKYKFRSQLVLLLIMVSIIAIEWHNKIDQRHSSNDNQILWTI